MRRAVAGAMLLAGLAALAQPAGAQQRSGWTYVYANGVATATERDDSGRVTATITCRPPTGDIVLSDFTLARDGRRARNSTVRIGQGAVTVPSRVEGRGRDRALTINLPQRPPILAAVQPTDRLSVTVNNRTRNYAAGGPDKMKEVAYACWGA